MAVEDVRRPLEGCAQGLEGFIEANEKGKENVVSAMGHLAVAITALSVAQEELAAAGIDLNDAGIHFGVSTSRARTAVLFTEKVDTRASDNPTVRALPAFVIPLEKRSRETMAGVGRLQLAAEDHSNVVANILEEVKQAAANAQGEQEPLQPRTHEANDWAEKIRVYLGRF